MKNIAAIAVLFGCLCKAFAGETVASVPYHWRNVSIGGGGFVTGLITQPQAGDILYARTDVGGAYRRDAAARRWIPLTDSFAAMDFTGIESLALDPQDPFCVYLAAGIYSGSRAAIFRSDNQGRTWQRTEVPFKMGGNEPGRFNGERLVVNPKDDRILFFGSRRDGLWKSPDRGATWSQVTAFPTIEEPKLASSRRWFGARPVGIVCVLYDGATIYAAVSTLGTNLFRSADGGDSWQPVPNQPIGLRPNHIVRASDGTLYLSYGKQPGPEFMSDGAVWKFDPRNDKWSDITPVKPADDGQPFGYGAVAVDANNPQVLLATTFCHWHPHDEVFRSTNGGASWKPLLATARFDHSIAPYTTERTPHWMGSVVINPSNSNEAWFTTGYGLWCCTNLTAADAGGRTDWIFADQGLEETVPLALISPPKGAHLLSGVGDIDGFRHDDLDASPAQGSFSGPRFGNTESLAFAAQKPSLIVRTGTGGKQTHAAISKDRGKSWRRLPTAPPSSADGAGTIALSANGKTIVWTPLRSLPSFSVDGGGHWTNCLGVSHGLGVVADPVNSSRFYAFDAQAGMLLRSTNAAANFSDTGASLPALDDSNDACLAATPGLEGDLWLMLHGNGLYHSLDGGVTFTRTTAVLDASSMGFGKAASGRKFPALYLAGKVGDSEGLFRSVDTGATWTRINDPQHQYGEISRVTGDPRIFGRVYFATGGRGIIYGDEGKE